MFATRKIKIGKKIMEELPILVLRDRMSKDEFETDHYPNISEESRTKIFKLHDPADNINSLNNKQYELWKGTHADDLIWDLLSECDDVSRTLRIFRDNFFPICTATDTSGTPLYNGPEHGLYYEMSYINHGCIPNAEDSWVKGDLQRRKLWALKTIEKNEEILINYHKTGEFDYGTREFRRQKLLRTCGFLCLCSECSLEGKALEDNERMRAEIREKGLEIIQLAQREEATRETAVKAMKLTEEKVALVKKLDIRLSLVDELLDACHVASDAQNFGIPAHYLNDLIKSYHKSAHSYAQLYGDRHLHSFPDLESP